MKQSNSMLLASVESSLDRPSATIVLTDFALARSQLQFALKLKLQPLQQLPHALVAIADDQPSRAQAAARKCLRLFAARAVEDHHPLSVLLLGAGSQLRVQILAFSQGEKLLDDLPELENWIAKFRFILSSERRIEGAHAKVHRDILGARHHGPLHVAYNLVAPQLDRLLDEDPQSLPTLAAACRSCRSPLRAIEKMGLGAHPTVLQMLRKDARRSVSRCSQTLVDILWHCDGHALFSDHSVLAAELTAGEVQLWLQYTEYCPCASLKMDFVM